MISPSDLRKSARSYLRAARILNRVGSNSPDASAYLCGYSIEIALKFRICLALDWIAYPETNAEFQGYTSFKTPNMIARKEMSVMNSEVENLLDVMRKTEREITFAHGEFNLFALFERLNISGRWDLVVSAPWLPEGRKGIQIIANYIARLPKAEAIQIARIVPLAPESAPVRSIVDVISIVNEGVVPVGPIFVGSAEVIRGYILVSQKESLQPVGIQE